MAAIPTKLDKAKASTQPARAPSRGDCDPDESAHCATSDEEQSAPECTRQEGSACKRPLAVDDADASRRVSSRLSVSSICAADDAAPSSGDDAPAGEPPPDRKIWMRACNNCGHELHVRRTRCTECGTPQASKRAIATAKQEADRAAAAAVNADQMRQEAVAAASQLTNIITAAPPADVRDGNTDVAAASPPDAGSSTAPAPSAAATAPTERQAAAHTEAKTLADAMAQLSPEQLIKLRRIRKLRTLLSKIPAPVHAAGEPPSASSSSPQDDAISMLASVACSS